MVDGRERHAREFLGVPAGERPLGLCPCCGEAIVWKVGDVVAPHVAHRPDSDCAATNPETAAHLNAKAALARFLGASSSLAIAGLCGRAHPVVASWSIAPWAHARPEYRLGTRRPDVSLLRDDLSGIAAVEVLHTHAVDEAKAADLAAANLPWIEVRSLEAMSWDGLSPLTTHAVDRSTQAALDASCERCEVERAELAAAAAADRAERDRKRAAFEAVIRESQAASSNEARERRRAADLPQLMANPPSIHIAVAVAMRGNPGRAVVAAVVMIIGRRPHTRTLDVVVGSGEAAWHALEFALNLVEMHTPGRGATIHIAEAGPAYSANHANGRGELKHRVCDAVVRTGSVVAASTAADPGAANALWWIAMAKDEARRVLEGARRG